MLLGRKTTNKPIFNKGAGRRLWLIMCLPPLLFNIGSNLFFKLSLAFCHVCCCSCTLAYWLGHCPSSTSATTRNTCIHHHHSTVQARPRIDRIIGTRGYSATTPDGSTDGEKKLTELLRQKFPSAEHIKVEDISGI